MTQVAEQNKLYTVEEYFQIEENTDYRNEYYDGEIYARAGGSGNHTLINKNLIQHVNNLLADRDCNAVGSDLRIYIEPENTFVYPDVMVVCGGFKYLKGRNDTITNPSIVFEVLSKSTQNYDKNDKFRLYQKLDTFKEYILVDQYKVYVQRFWRINDGKWEFENFDRLEKVVELKTLGIVLPLALIYRGIDVPEPYLRKLPKLEQE